MRRPVVRWRDDEPDLDPRLDLHCGRRMSVRLFDALTRPGSPLGEEAGWIAGPPGRAFTVGPFLLVARAHQADLPPGSLPIDADIRPHPHIGLAALTYVKAGAITHRDTLGNTRELRAGDLGYMVAGSGVSHSERFDRARVEGGALELFQILIALPDHAQGAQPSFRVHTEDELPRFNEEGVEGVVWLGRHHDALSPIDAYGSAWMIEIELAPGARWALPSSTDAIALYVLEGEASVRGETISARRVGLVEGEAVLTCDDTTRVLLFSGQNPGLRHFWWNYVHSDIGAIEAAKATWRGARRALPSGDTESFTPAPADDERPLAVLNRADEP